MQHRSITFAGLQYGDVRPALADLLHAHCAGGCAGSPDDVPDDDTPHGFVDQCGDGDDTFFRVAHMTADQHWLNAYIGLLSTGELPTCAKMLD